MSMSTDHTTTGALELRILQEGYGQGAWHGPDLKAALADVTEETAFVRPAPGRHNIAEIALHHAYYVRGVRAKLMEIDPEPFIVDGDDWFELSDPTAFPWSKVLEVMTLEQERLMDCVARPLSNAVRSPLPESDRFELVLGITCHAVYHAGQVQLIKRLVPAP